MHAATGGRTHIPAEVYAIEVGGRGSAGRSRPQTVGLAATAGDSVVNEILDDGDHQDDNSAGDVDIDRLVEAMTGVSLDSRRRMATRRQGGGPAVMWPRRLTPSSSRRCATPAGTAATTASERDYESTIIEAARSAAGSSTASGRPARRRAGGRRSAVTPAGRTCSSFTPTAERSPSSSSAARTARRPNRLSWLLALELAGIDARLVWVPDELDALVAELVGRSERN